MSEVLPPSRKGRTVMNPSIAQLIDAATTKCPGCLFNCYIMEESIGLNFSSLKMFLISAVDLLLSIPTLIQMARVFANREQAGWGKGTEAKSE